MVDLGKTRTWLAPLASAALAAASAAHAGSTQATGAQDSTGLARVQRQIEEREYHASRNQRGLQAPNRTHNLRAYFEPEGLRLHDRTAPGEPELMALRLAALGRVGSERLVPAGEVSSDGARVEIRRPGLIEWYLNAGVGLEQGFTLDARPEGAGRLSLKLAVSSGSARSAGVGAALLRAESGRELRYGGLAVVDARGQSLAAELFVTPPHELRIEVDDADAVYPLTVDPLVTSVADAVLQSDQAEAHLGISVAGAGDVNGDGYDDVIVGAYGYDLGEESEGAAFVFLGGPAGLANGGPATASATLQGDQFGADLGYGVAGAGDVNGDGYGDVIVGAIYFDAGENNEGAAFVFLGGPAGIANGSPATASATLQPNQTSATMGLSVAGAGDVNGDGYDDVIVGAPTYGNGGSAFVFLGGPTGIQNGDPTTAHARLQPNQSGAYMGQSAAGAGDVNGDGYDDVIVGARLYDAGQAYEGAAFVFLGGPAGIPNGNPSTASAVLQANQIDADMGFSVDGAGDVNGDGYADVIVGALGYESGQTAEGAAFVFLGGPAGIPNGNPSTASATLQADQDYARMGGSVAGAGDLNDDGYDDVIVGATDITIGQTNEGAAFVFMGGPAGVASGNPLSARVWLQADQADANMGASVAGAGDVNGDGFADVIVGAPDYDGGANAEGAAFLYLGGFEVKGDLNGDLKPDLVVRYQPTGVNLAWLMNGTTRVSQTAITPDPTSLNWRIVGIDEFNGNLRNDLVLSNQVSGATEFWLMNGTARQGAAVPLASPLAPPWKLSATADFNRDGKTDLVWRNFATQKIVLWTMNNVTKVGEIVPSPDQAVAANWEIVAALDWNGDHHTDFLWYNATSGKIVLWFMDEDVVRITGQFTNPPNAGNNNWNVVAAGDYGRGPSGLAGTKDIVWRNATSGNLVVWHMDQAGNRTAGVFTTPSAPSPDPTGWTVVGPK